MLSQKRELFKGLENKIGEFFSTLGLSPNILSLASIVFVLFSFYFLINIKLLPASIFFIIAGFIDIIDGAVARYSQKTTKIGAYLDTIVDRYIEGIILLGFLFLPLPYFFLPSYVWIFLALFGSFLTTYAKAAAKEKEILKEEMKEGFFNRPERIILIFLSIIFGLIDLRYSLFLVIILAFVSNFSALQRISSVLVKKN